MLDRLTSRADRIGAVAVERAKRRIVTASDEPGVKVSTSEQGVILEGRRLSERLAWIGGLFR